MRRCFYVQVHGTLHWGSESLHNKELFTPAGFICHRYVLASGYEDATERAFRRVRQNLQRHTQWLQSGLAVLDLEAEEVRPAPLSRLLRRGNRGQVFYDEERAALPSDEEVVASAR